MPNYAILAHRRTFLKRCAIRVYIQRRERQTHIHWRHFHRCLRDFRPNHKWTSFTNINRTMLKTATNAMVLTTVQHQVNMSSKCKASYLYHQGLYKYHKYQVPADLKTVTFFPSVHAKMPGGFTR